MHITIIKAVFERDVNLHDAFNKGDESVQVNQSMRDSEGEQPRRIDKTDVQPNKHK
jgi:hypothetical protein